MLCREDRRLLGRRGVCREYAPDFPWYSTGITDRSRAGGRTARSSHTLASAERLCSAHLTHEARSALSATAARFLQELKRLIEQTMTPLIGWETCLQMYLGRLLALDHPLEGLEIGFGALDVCREIRLQRDRERGQTGLPADDD